jgi:hypothetical protein
MSKEWIDPTGQKVPAQYVPAIDKKKTTVVTRYITKAQKLAEQLEKFKEAMYADCDALYDEMREDANVVTRSKKGGYTLTTFSKDMKIEVSIDEKVSFDDNIMLAQEKLRSFLDMKLAKTGDTDVTELVNHAFKTRKGKLDTARVLGLMSLNINHPQWKEGIELIRKSITRNVTKRYVQMFTRDEEGVYHPVVLNISSI